uniref:Smg4_UPF3 domain-containing protein n=1 Tax=Caenorhabditis tropicalis TaxID=1561998 RepID=A0A1I7UN67_9PELO
MSTGSDKSGPSDPVKVVLRRLPKYMTEKEVLEQISPLPEEVIETYFRPANLAFDHAAFATLTLVFSEYCDSMMDFERRFDGYIFVDSRGNDSAAVVEAAVNQRFSKCNRERMKQDSRVGAILTDKYYLEFCQKLENEMATPIMTLEQQIKKLNQPESIRTQLSRLETPLVKFFIEKEAVKRRDNDVRRQKRDLKRAEKQKNVLDILMKPSTTASTSGSVPTKKEAQRDSAKPLTEKEKEKLEKLEARKKERNAIRKQKFLDEKKKKRDELEGENPKPPRGPRENNKKKERPPKPARPSPAKTLGEQQGEDWIKKLTDPKAPIKKKHDLPDIKEERRGDGTRPKTTAARSNHRAPQPKRPPAGSK